DDYKQVTCRGQFFGTSEFHLWHALTEQDCCCFEKAATGRAKWINLTCIDAFLQFSNGRACTADGAGCSSRGTMQFDDALRAVACILVQAIKILRDDTEQ